jgi:hypothetical protein
VNGSELYAGGMPRSERSRISGCDSRKAARSRSNLGLWFSVSAHRGTHTRGGGEVDDKHTPDGRREGAQPEGGISGEYPSELAVSIFVDGRFHAESAQSRQQPERLVYQPLECKKHSVVAKVESECPDELTPSQRGIYQ